MGHYFKPAWPHGNSYWFVFTSMNNKLLKGKVPRFSLSSFSSLVSTDTCLPADIRKATKICPILLCLLIRDFVSKLCPLLWRLFGTCIPWWCIHGNWTSIRGGGFFKIGCPTSCKVKTAFLVHTAELKTPDAWKICCNHPNIWMWLYHRLMHPKDADRMANSVDPDQTTPLEAVWSGSTLFAPLIFKSSDKIKLWCTISYALAEMLKQVLIQFLYKYC